MNTFKEDIYEYICVFFFFFNEIFNNISSIGSALASPILH